MQDNAGVIVNPKGEMKGSAITGPVAKECVRVAPSVLSNNKTHPSSLGGSVAAYCLKRGYRRMSTVIVISISAFLSMICTAYTTTMSMPCLNMTGERQAREMF